MTLYSFLANHARYFADSFNKKSATRALSLLGVGVTLKLCWSGLVGIYESSFRTPINLIQTYGQGSYALITGGAQGIGKQFAIDLAKRNFNLIILDVNTEALNQTVQDIKVIYPQTDVIVKTVDFSLLKNPEQYRDLYANFSHLDISILINNVGIGIGCVGLFDKLPVSLIMRAFVINLYPAVFFTKLFMEHNANRQNRSLVINMSSGSALDAVPYFFLYGAAKKYLLSMGESLMLEQLATKGKTDVISFTPLYISTGLIGFRTGAFVISTQQFVDSALRQVQYTPHHEQVGREYRSIGHWIHRLHAALPVLLFGKRGNTVFQELINRPHATMVTQKILEAMQAAKPAQQ